MFGANKKVKCITCKKEIAKQQAIKDFDLYFCSEKCHQEYKEHLDSIDKDFNLDNCC